MSAICVLSRIDPPGGCRPRHPSLVALPLPMTRASAIVKSVVLILLGVGLAAYAIHVEMSGQPVTFRGRYGGPGRTVGADRAALYIAATSLTAIVGAVMYFFDYRKLTRVATREERAAAGLCIFCGHSRAGLMESAKCPECGKARH